MSDKIQESYKGPVSIDWKMNMAKSIASQIMNNEECKKNYSEILAIACLKISDAIKHEENIVKTTVCCGRELFFTNVIWSTPRCDKCGKNLNE